MLVLLVLLFCPAIQTRIFFSYFETNETIVHEGPRVGWFKTYVDHFGFQNNDTFLIRYVYSDEHYVNNGPVFLYAGNEGDIFGFVNNTGFMWEHAAEFNAYVIFVEHRYYGESIPYKHSSQHSPLTYLSSEQAMFDIIDLVSSMFSPETKIIAFGGSYGGMLAAWLRMKYPAYITGALASSAPIRMFSGYTDCSIPYDIITKAFRLANGHSVDNVRMLWHALKNQDLDSLWNQLSLCPSDKKTVSILINNITEIFFNVAMVNYPSPSSLLVPLPATPVTLIADFFGKQYMSESELVKALGLTLNLYFNNTGNAPKCFDFDDMYVGLDNYVWGYQACTEIILSMCSKEGPYNMFPPFSMDMGECEVYGVSPRPEFLPKQTNIKDFSSYSNIIFSNGLLDPWSGGGYYDTSNDKLTVITIEGGAHHVDLRESSPSDPPSVIQARKKEVEIIRGWLTTN